MKQLTEEFYNYVAKIYDEPLDQYQYNEMERAFIGGAIVILGRLTKLTTLNEDEGIKSLEDLHEQVKQYIEKQR